MMKRLGKLAALFFAAMSLCAAAHAQVHASEPPADWAEKPVLRWTIFDVDEGDAMLLECGGESMLVDGGPNPFREQLRDALMARGLEHSMKYMFSTHFHDDHIDGLYRLFQYGFTAGEFLHAYSDRTAAEDMRMSRTIREAKRNGVPVRRVVDGDMLTLGDAQLQVMRCLAISGDNARSLVLKVQYKDASILLCADIVGQVQHWFHENRPQDLLDADLIKAPHHGINRTVTEFLHAVSPETMIITNERRRMYHETIDQLEHENLPAYFSGDGTVYAVTDGTDWYVYQTPGEF